MANPRRPSYSAAAGPAISLESGQGGAAAQAPRGAFSSSALVHFLKKPHAFPFLLSAFLLLTWISLRLQSRPSASAAARFSSNRDRERSREEDDRKANLVRFPLGSFSDKRGWLLDPTSVALDSGIRGGAVTCASIHVGEIRPGGVRGNHRHHTCNETFVIWGAKTKFRKNRLEEIESEGWFKLIGAERCRVSGSEIPVGFLQGAPSSTPSTSRKVNGIIVRVLCSINGCSWKLELFRVFLKASLSSLLHWFSLHKSASKCHHISQSCFVYLSKE
ncbi:uncharacterized protein LOC115683333 isoform X1 [Syzygium oleosum]|uniref:uncharacterized protein LOC115683333 isoform X1 n=1 Tax=Syzygium oleosum TaxID=219896 RepID=UPI0011D20C8F|nr:uncharacterized protein LOC115683333 isoform X1 [Syzygium oleosum]